MVTRRRLFAPTAALLCALLGLAIPSSSAQEGAARPIDGAATAVHLQESAPGWEEKAGISFGSKNFSGIVTNKASGTDYTCAADGEALSVATPSVTGTMRPARQVSTMKVSGYAPKGVTPQRGEVTDPAQLAQIAYIAAMPAGAPKDVPPDVEAAAREAAIARAAGVYRNSMWDLAARGKLTLANGSALKPAAERSARIHEEAKQLAGPYRANISLTLQENGESGQIDGIGVESQAGTWLGDKQFDVVLKGPAHFESGGREYSGRTDEQAIDGLQFTVTGAGEISAVLTIREIPDSLPWISEGESNLGRAQNLIELGRTAGIEATASAVVQWRPQISSQASLEMGPETAGIRDVITVSGMPEEGGDVPVLEDSQQSAVDHYLYFIPAGTKHVEGISQQLEPIARVQTPARNGEHTIEPEDFPIDRNLGMGTYQVVSEYPGSEYVAGTRTSDVEPSEQVTPVFGNVRTRAFSPDGELHPGGSVADSVILEGIFPDGAYTAVDLFSWNSGEAPVCDEPLWTAPRIEHGNENGEFETESFVTPEGVEATYGFVERTYDHLGNLISQGECGAESETLTASVPPAVVPETPKEAPETPEASPSAQTPPAETPPAETPPAETPPAETPTTGPSTGVPSTGPVPASPSPAVKKPAGQAPAKELPRTGAVSDLLIPLGLGLLAAGAGALFVSMRRR